MKFPPGLFKEHHYLRAGIDAGLEGRAGRMISTGPQPSAVRFDFGCYSVLGGDQDLEDAHSLIESAPPSQKAFKQVTANPHI